MIEIRYISKQDGWAVISINSLLSLVRPPYRNSSTIKLTEDSVSKIINIGEFFPSDQSFSNYNSLIEFLNKTVAESRADYLAHDQVEMAHRLVKSSSQQDLVKQIEIINKNISSNISEDIAESLALAIISRARDLGSELVINGGLNIIESLIKNRVKRQAVVDSINDIARSFPLASVEYGEKALKELSDTISKRRSMFGFTALALAA